MTWIKQKPDETSEAFLQRVNLWLIQHPTWAMIYDDIWLSLRDRYPALDKDSHSLMAYAAYASLYAKFGGAKND